MARNVRIQIDCVVTIAGPGVGIPHVPSINGLIIDGLRSVLPDDSELHGGARLTMTDLSFKRGRTKRSTGSGKAVRK